MENIEILLKKLAEGTLSPSEESFLFDWLHDHKDQWSLSMYDKYRQAISKNTRLLSDERSSALLKAIHAKIDSDEDGPMSAYSHPGRRLWRSILIYTGAAASLLLLLVVGWQNLLPNAEKGPISYGTSSTARDLNTVTNTRAHVVPVVLPDGSSVLLYPKSSLTYNDFSGENNREVFLTGKAFFEVMRNPDKPFLVQTHEMVTTVLGTSFMVNADESQPHYSVLVKTGSVAVSGKGLGKSSKEPLSVTLKENEEAVFDRSSEAFITVGIPSDKALSENIIHAPKEYRFRATPVTDILDTLSRDYNVEFETDREVLANCSLTTVLKDKPLFDKLRIICEGIGPGTSFSVRQDVVVITTLGCNN